MKRILALVCAAAVLLACAACGSPAAAPEETAPQGKRAVVEAQLGQGAAEFLLNVVPPEGPVKVYTIRTDKGTVGEALLELGLVAGEVSQFGLMVKTVDGVTADFNKDGAWWKFTINGEDAVQGVSQTAIEPQALYGLTYTVD